MFESQTEGRHREPTTKKQKAAEKIKYKRRTFEFHPHMDDVLDQLQEQLKVRSHTDVLQKAIQVLAILTGEEGERTRVFISRDDGELKELLIV